MCWPAGEERRAWLAERGVARLLLVEGDVAPPQVVDYLEDWIRLPASEADQAARVTGLVDRSRRHRRLAPELDAHGVLRFGVGWVALPPLEASLADALIAHFAAAVGRDTLWRAAWPTSAPVSNALDVHIFRLRRRLAPLGLAIHTVRHHGYTLQPADPEIDITTTTTPNPEPALTSPSTSASP